MSVAKISGLKVRAVLAPFKRPPVAASGAIDKAVERKGTDLFRPSFRIVPVRNVG